MAEDADVRVDTVDLRGETIAYRRAGEGPPLLFLHGLGFSDRWWPLYTELATRFDVIVPDLPGFGASPQVERIRDWDDLVLILAEFLDVLGIAEVELVGHSFGGWAAAEFASFYPERVRNLVLVTPLGLRVAGATPVDVFRQTPEQRLALLVGDGEVDVHFPAAGDDDRFERKVRDYLDLTGFGRLAWNPRYDWRLERRLGRVTAPALVVGVDDDRVLPGAHIDAYAALLPSARVLTVSGDAGPSGHGVVAQAPRGLSGVIATFIGEK